MSVREGTPEALRGPEFSALLDSLGPFEPNPHVAIAASGGADSMALALLARDWARARHGRVIALIVDHGLRPESAAEARLTADRLQTREILCNILTLKNLSKGSALAERARDARHAVLESACAERGIVHLLYAHHAADQAETIAMRRLSRSHAAGLAGMAALVETATIRRLRPLLTIPPGRLRATLREAGLAWVEDPSNADPTTLRARLRAAHADADGTGPEITEAVAFARAAGQCRARAEQGQAVLSAARASLYPGGYAILAPGPLGPAVLAALLRAVAGAPRPPPLRQTAALAASPGPATLGGARLLPAGKLGPGAWLLAREPAAMAPPVAATLGARWDGRFRLTTPAPPGAMLGALGPDAAAFRRCSNLPAAVLRTLPALRVEGKLVAVPHLDYAAHRLYPPVCMVFDPGGPAVSAPFVPS